MMPDNKNRDGIPKTEIEHFNDLMPGMKILGSILGLFDPKVKNATEKITKEWDKIKAYQEAEKIYRKKFVPLGWATFDQISTQLLTEIQTLSIEDGERVLIDYFLDDGQVQLTSYLFKRQRFQAWSKLFELASNHLGKTDFLSAIPLIIMITDGLCQRYLSLSPYSGSTEKDIYDTLTTGDGGLGDTFRIHGRSRTKRMNVDPIEIPFRNGILHGNDINYGFPIVAAKALNALVATISFIEAGQSEQQRISKSLEEQKPVTWSNGKEIAQKLLQNEKINQANDEWAAREPIENQVLACSGGQNQTEQGSPEAATVEFLELISRKNLGKLAEHTVNFANYSVGKIAGIIRKDLDQIELISWDITGVEDTAPAASWVDAKLVLKVDGVETECEYRFRVISENENRSPIPRNIEGVVWRFMPSWHTDLWRLKL